jgi:hypothetical protein
VSGWLGFSLFRDPFSVSVVKNIVQYSLLWPLLVAFGLSYLTWTAKKVESAAGERVGSER